MAKIQNSKRVSKLGFRIFPPKADPPLAENLFRISAKARRARPFRAKARPSPTADGLGRARPFRDFGFRISRRGFTLIEIIVYIAILAVISVIAVNTFLVVHASLAEIRVTRTINAASSVVMESMTRIIRGAKAVDIAGSSFDFSPGVLIVTDSALPPATHRFSIGSNRMKYQKNAEPAIDLTGPGVLAGNLVFRLINASTISQAIKIELTLEASSGKTTTTQNFYNTVVLRNSYSR